MSRQGWPANSKDIYTHNAAMFFIQVRNICFKCNLRMGGRTIFKVAGTSARQKK